MHKKSTYLMSGKTGIIIVLFLFLFVRISAQKETPKVMIHYMGWYAEGDWNRHWSYGHAYNSLIGEYNSLSWATQMYHILLSWTCGIDGLVINVKDEYDASCLTGLVQTLKKLKEIDSSYFKYYLSISYDDQGLSDRATAIEKFKYLRDHILTEPIDFLRIDSIPTIFVFNYKDAYLTVDDYAYALDSVFPVKRPKFVWNEIEETALGRANSFYPWVQASGEWNGDNWGQPYLQWFYPKLSEFKQQLNFATAGVWPGFDDRPNISWGGTRWIDRKNGAIYDNTWSYVTGYAWDLPLKCVVIETWNDWNEGTQIEPDKSEGFKYLIQTIENINLLKDTSISTDSCRMEVAKKMYKAAYRIENKFADSSQYYPVLKRAIASFIQNKCKETEDILDSIPDPVNINSADESGTTIDILNPIESQIIKIRISTQKPLQSNLSVCDISGRTISTLYSGLINDKMEFELKLSNLKTGMYFCILKTPVSNTVKKFLVNRQ